MTSKLSVFFLIASGVTMIASAARADEFALDGAHAAATFKISHIGLSWTNGRFKDLSGSFNIDPANPVATRFDLTAKTESVDTDNAKRDEHLRSPDFFNGKQFPAVNFKS